MDSCSPDPKTDPFRPDVSASTEAQVVDISALQEEVRSLYATWARNLLLYAKTFLSDEGAAQDAVQEAFLRYFLYRSEGGGVLNPKAWLFKVLRNFMLDCSKDAFRKNRVDLKEALLQPDLREDPHRSMENKEIYHNIVTQLTFRELDCIRLRIEGFNYEEIADMINIAKGTVGAILTRAIQKIQKGL